MGKQLNNSLTNFIASKYHYTYSILIFNIEKFKLFLSKMMQFKINKKKYTQVPQIQTGKTWFKDLNVYILFYIFKNVITFSLKIRI